MAASGGQEGFIPTGGDFGAQDKSQASKDMDEAQLHKIFNHFDSDGSGSIDVDELRSAMMALGIKVTLSSCKKILSVIDQDKNGTIEWDEFHAFFEKVKDPEEIKSMLSSANAKYMDYKQMVEGDPNFEKRFFVPKIVSNTYKLQGHEDNVECVQWLDHKSSNFLSCSLDGTLRLWNSAQGRQVEILAEGYKSGMYCMSVYGKGKKVVVGLGAKEKNCVLFDLAKGGATSAESMGDIPLLREYNGPAAPIYSVAVEKGKTPGAFLCGAKNGHLAYFDITRSEPLSSMTDIHEGVVYSVDLHQDGNRMCSASSDGLVQIGDFRSPAWKITATIEDAAASGIPYKALWRGERELMSCGDDYCIKKWDVRMIKNGAVENYLGHTSAVRQICLSEDNQYLVSAANDGSIRLWVIDERIRLQQENDANQQKIMKLEKQRAGFDHKLYEGDEDINEDELKKMVHDLEKSYRRHNYLGAATRERDAMQCIQSSIACEGHTLPLTTVAFRTHPNDSTKAEIVSGAQDQNCMTYILKKPKLTEFIRWAKDDDAGEPVSP